VQNREPLEEPDRPRRRPLRHVSVRSELARMGAWGLVDQTILSGTSFLTLVVAARFLTPDDFGAYVLAFTGLLVLNGLQGSLFGGPHNVLGITRRGADYVRYTAATAASQLAFATAFAVLALVVGAILVMDGDPGGYLSLALAPALFAWQIQEFLRRVLYTEGRIPAAVANDVVSYGGQVVGIVFLWRLGGITGPALLLVVAATSAAGVVLGLVQLRSSLGLTIDASCVRENWQFGKWLAGANAGFWLSSAAVVYLAAGILGSSAPGILKAAQIVLGPLNVLLLFLATVLPIIFSRALARSEQALKRRLKLVLAMSGPLVVVYCLAAALLARPIMHALYAGKYDAYAHIVGLVALYYFVDYFSQVIRDVLKARRVTRPVFVGNILGGLAAVVVAPGLLVSFGVAGAALAMLVSIVVLNVTLVRAFARSRADAARPEVGLLQSEGAAPLR
jgi:O-antigen/teichoic acid export membrane protein